MACNNNREHRQPLHRHPGMMMKSRTLFVISIGLLIIGTALFIFSRRNQEHRQIYPATIYRDCAPWDGSAFTVSITLSDGTFVDISIWQSPDFNFPKSFSFPDDTGQAGNASYRSASVEYEQLSGKVVFQRVNDAIPVDGEFHLGTEDGRSFEGQFEAEWKDTIALCG